MLVPMLGAYLPSNIIIYVQGLKISLFSVDTKYIKNIEFVNQMITRLNFTQPNEYLVRIDFDSGSTLINNVFTIIGIILVMLLSL